MKEGWEKGIRDACEALIQQIRETREAGKLIEDRLVKLESRLIMMLDYFEGEVAPLTLGWRICRDARAILDEEWMDGEIIMYTPKEMLRAFEEDEDENN